MVNSNLAFSYSASGFSQQEVQIQDEPLKWCSVSLSKVIAKGSRLDASTFDVEALNARDIIENGKYGYAPLGGASGLINTAFYPGRFKRIYCDKDHGEEFYLPSQMTDIYPKSDKYISALTKCDMNELRLKAHTLLLTRSGTIGTVSYVSKTIEGKVFSDDVIRVTFHKESVLGYVYAYLKSKVGNLILTTNGYGSVITHLEPEHLYSLPIPNAPDSIKDEINSLIVRSFELRDESNELLDWANDLLVKELELPPIQEFQKKAAYYQKAAPVDTFSVKLSNLDGRFDGSYHVPVVDAIVEHLKKHAAEVTTVGDSKISRNVILAGIFKRTYVEEGCGYPFLGGKEITQLSPKVEKYLSKPVHKNRYEKELKVEENMILVSDRGTIGKVALVPKHWNGYAVSQNVLKLVPANNNIAGYLYVFLASDIGNVLINRQTYGSVVDMIDNNSLINVEVPILKNQTVQAEINSLALQANEKRYQAYLLEQEALKKMNDEVIYAK